MAITMLPPKEIPGSVKPVAIAMIAPRAAPEDTPMVDPSASGLRRRPCMAAPHMDKAAPASVTQRTRGSRTFSIMFLAMFSGRGKPQAAFQTAVTVSEKEILTLPTQMHRTIVKKSAAVRRRYVTGVNFSRFSCRISCMDTS